jgi:hypothetical protein
MLAIQLRLDDLLGFVGHHSASRVAAQARAIAINAAPSTTIIPLYSFSLSCPSSS